jgi:hypothetical protein
LCSAENIYTPFLQQSVKHKVTAIRREEEEEGVGKEGGREMEEGGLAGGRGNFQN